MIQAKHQFVPREPFRVLVSGGIDSVAAAIWLKRNFKKEFTIVHFVHNVQALNMNMLCAVQDLCDDFNIPLIVRERGYDNEQFSDVSECGLRQWRLYEMQELGGGFVTAHHINDAVENYLENCFKGCPEHLPIRWQTNFDNFSLYHPFLLSAKRDFIQYIDENNYWKYVVEDPTNKDEKYKRNWIRNSLVPAIEERCGLESVVRKKFYNL